VRAGTTALLNGRIAWRAGEDVHFHPVEKPSARLSATWRF